MLVDLSERSFLTNREPVLPGWHNQNVAGIPAASITVSAPLFPNKRNHKTDAPLSENIALEFFSKR